MVTRSMQKKRNGFTLIELMLATSLLMLIMFSGYYAYSLYTQKWQKRVEFFWLNTEQAIALDVINKMLSAANSYVVKCKNGNSCIYFSGTSTSLRFITNSPIYSKNNALVELTVESINDGLHLVYREKSLDKSPLFTLTDVVDVSSWQRTTILLSNLDELTWQYYGWQSFDDALAQSDLNLDNNTEDTRRWYSEHDGNAIRILPITIQLKFLNRAKNQSTRKSTNILIGLPNNSLFKLIADIRVDA